jgi:DNA-binding transcriptional LysR family regulator
VHIELRHLRYFLAVAEELNFSRAAERLHIAQPALSSQIRTLEKQLGCDLFIRTTRSVSLTANGRMFAEDAREIVERADAAVARIEAAARGERGTLRVGFFVHGAAELGTEILHRFAEEFPSIEAEMVSAATLEEAQRSVRDRETDVAFVCTMFEIVMRPAIPSAARIANAWECSSSMRSRWPSAVKNRSSRVGSKGARNSRFATSSSASSSASSDVRGRIVTSRAGLPRFGRKADG